MIRGITVTLVDKVETGVDAFGHPQYATKQVCVENVLVTPSSTDDITTSTDLTGKKAVYTLAIPKTDKNDWVNRQVEFFGKRFRTIGIPQEGIADNIPLLWNKKVMVEHYE